MAGRGGFIGARPYGSGGRWSNFDVYEGFKQLFVAASGSGGTTSVVLINNEPYQAHTFSYTGSNQTFTLNSAGSLGLLDVYMWGAAGGGGNAEGYSDSGGPGGYAYGQINARSLVGTSLIVQVGQGGGTASGGTTRPARPYPAGGLPALRTSYVCGAGGGRSGMFISSVTAGNALLIAGGGGGAAGHGGGSGTSGNGCTGGGGGGTTGTGGRQYDGQVINNPGTQSAAGAYQTAGQVAGSTPPGQLQGGDAGNGTNFSSGGWNSAGGGGDGWYGGGSQEAHVGGGGGSGYFNTSYVSGGDLQATTPSNGKLASVNPPQTASQFWASGIGVGNSNATGGNGKVVVLYKLASLT